MFEDAFIGLLIVFALFVIGYAVSDVYDRMDRERRMLKNIERFEAAKERSVKEAMREQAWIFDRDRPIPWDDGLDVSKLEVRHEPGSQD